MLKRKTGGFFPLFYLQHTIRDRNRLILFLSPRNFPVHLFMKRLQLVVYPINFIAFILNYCIPGPNKLTFPSVKYI